MKLFSIYYTDVLNVYIIEEYGEKKFLLFRIEYLKRTERTWSQPQQLNSEQNK